MRAIADVGSSTTPAATAVVVAVGVLVWIVLELRDIAREQREQASFGSSAVTTRKDHR